MDAQPPKKPFRVYLRYVECPYVDLYARDAKEAEEIAKKLDDEVLHASGGNDMEWEYYRAIEVDEDSSFSPIDYSDDPG